jgi:hypothetical protein
MYFAGPHANQDSENSVTEAVAQANENTVQKVLEQKPQDIGEMAKLFQGMGGKGEWGWGSILGKGGQLWKNLAGIGGGATGGYVTKKGIQGFAGGGQVKGIHKSDTVPAMLTPGEVVLTPGQLKGMAGSNTVVNVNMGEGGGSISGQQSDSAQASMLGKAIAGAVNKEIAKQKRVNGSLYIGGPGGW